MSAPFFPDNQPSLRARAGRDSLPEQFPFGRARPRFEGAARCGAAPRRRRVGWEGAGSATAGSPRRRALQIQSLIRTIPDFPIPGILFRDITPVLKDPSGFKAAVDLFVDRYKGKGIDVVVAMEARGYMLGAPLAYEIGAGFVPVRKPGKLPGSKLREEYALEYGTNSLEIHDDAVGDGHRVLVVDDLLATGGTAAATARLLEKLGAHIAGFAFLVELEALGGRALLGGYEVTSFITY
ncbi:MAG: adenine phosphoribosyltransferase [Candidatus Baltobacteraceae bacterium]